jgi:hypothetical protein
MTESLSPLLTLMEMQWEMAKRYFSENPKKECAPQFLAETADRKRMVILAPWGSEAEKVALLTMLKWKFVQHEVKRYVMCSEAWVARYDADKDDPNFKMPSEHPERVEILMLIGVDAEAGEILQYHAEIKHRNGKRSLGERITLPYGGFEGRVTELLGPIAKRTVN